MKIESLHAGIPETPNNLEIRAALHETLGKARQAGIELYLTGGTAAAVYAGETRPLSRDLDFFVEKGQRGDVVKIFGGQFRVFGEKKLFKSDKLVAQAGNGVDLDFIAEQNIVPDEKSPDQKITLKLSDLARKYAGAGEFMDEQVRVLPPELIVMAKLFAGRGLELGKYDLHDSQAIIDAGHVRIDVLKQIILEAAENDALKFDLIQSRLMAAMQKLTSPGARALIQAISSFRLEDHNEVGQITADIRRTVIK